MRVAIVAEVFLPKIDGVVIRTMNLIRHLRESGDDVLVICPEADDRGDCGVALAEFPAFPFVAYPEYRIGTPDDRLLSRLDEFRPDVLHFLNPFAFGFRCHDLLQRHGRRYPCVFSFHTLYGEFVKRYPLLRPLSKMLWWMTKQYHNQADVNLTVSGMMQRELAARGFERVALWPPAVDSCLFAPDRASAEMRTMLSGGEPDRPLLLTVSRLAPEKNVEFLHSVMRKLPQAKLAIVGDGPHRGVLESKFADTDAVFHGYLKGEQLASAYASADAFVYASETETMGNVILEAMASGAPVVAPRAGGIPSLVDHEETGFLFEPGDADTAAILSRRLLDDSILRSMISRAARNTVEETGWRQSIDQVRECYRRTIASALSRSAPRLHRRSRMAAVAVQGLVTAFRVVSPRVVIRDRSTVRESARAMSDDSIPVTVPEAVSVST